MVRDARLRLDAIRVIWAPPLFNPHLALEIFNNLLLLVTLSSGVRVASPNVTDLP